MILIESIWSLIPPLLAIVMVLVTRRVLLSLGVGIVIAAMFLGNFKFIATFKILLASIVNVFYVDQALNMWNIYIILFLFLLGVLTYYIGVMGAAKSFGEWMIKRVKTRVGAQLMTIVLGVLLFIDDYFNSLTVGQIARPVTDKHKISRTKLAYLVDSTAAPICVIAPVSSWGAYILGLIGTVFVTHQVVDYTALNAFLLMIPMNYYVWSALGVVIVIAITQVDFGPMKKHELHTIVTGEVSLTKAQSIEETANNKSETGRVRELFMPIIVLLIATVFFIVLTGFLALEQGEISLINIFGEADVSAALFYGGLVAVITAIIYFTKHIQKGQLSVNDLVAGFFNGLKTMLPAILILVFAWAITDLIEQLGTGLYLAGLVTQFNVSFSLLPLIIFVLAGIIAFSTGTSWGAFALLMPIAGQIASASHMDLLLPMLAAVLAGAVFGDHCSPISDTTILSSTGSSCHHIDHVMTQLPYAVLSAGFAGLGYLVLGITGQVYLGLVVTLLGVLILFLINKTRHNRKQAL